MVEARTYGKCQWDTVMMKYWNSIAASDNPWHVRNFPIVGHYKFIRECFAEEVMYRWTAQTLRDGGKKIFANHWSLKWYASLSSSMSQFSFIPTSVLNNSLPTCSL